MPPILTSESSLEIEFWDIAQTNSPDTINNSTDRMTAGEVQATDESGFFLNSLTLSSPQNCHF
jgi:hypothetical protein